VLPNTLKSALSRIGMKQNDLPQLLWLPENWWTGESSEGEKALFEALMQPASP